MMESVWEPQGTVALRATTLTASMSPTDNRFKIDPRDARIWPYAGMVQIQGEFIRYNGKGYSYYNSAGVLTRTYINSQR